MAGRGGTETLDPASPAPPSDGGGLKPGDRVDLVYRVERMLGQGGGGAVYLVVHDGLDGARFALKVLHALGDVEALTREGRLAANVRSAHVVKVAALGRLPNHAPYLVMEYVDGPTLEDLLAAREPSPSSSPLGLLRPPMPAAGRRTSSTRARRASGHAFTRLCGGAPAIGSASAGSRRPRGEDDGLTIAEAADVGRQLCLALEAAHAGGLVHGDVSLRNVFVTPKPDGTLHVQLGDFGLARRVRAEAGAPGGSGRGTPRFMAPEVVAGGAADERSDLFGVGVVLYRLLGGAFPFDGDSAREILDAIRRGSPVPLGRRRATVRGYEAVVMRCLAADPAARFQTARDLREALVAATRAPAPSRRLRRAAAALAVAGLAAGGWSGVGAWRARARIPFGAALDCPDTAADDPDVGHMIAHLVCARIGAGIDVDWGGGEDATTVRTRLLRGDRWRLEVEVAGRVETASGATPYAAALEAARRLLARADVPPPDAEEQRRWGASDPATALGARAAFRRRTALVYDDIEAEQRAALARDPGLPFAQLVLAEVERDPALRGKAREAARASADRLPPDRAAAVRAFVDAEERPDAADGPLDALRRAYSASPDDVDVGVLYTGALVFAGRRETALAVADHLYERFPRRAALALHYATLLPDAGAGPVGRLIEAQPEARFSSPNLCLLASTGRLAEAEAAIDFARRLGVPEERYAIAAAVVAMTAGDPAQVEAATRAHEGMTGSWSQVVGARMRMAGLLLTGRVAEAESFMVEQMRARRAAGDGAAALAYGTERLRVARLAGGPPLAPDDLDWMEGQLAAADLRAYAAAGTELALARDPARAALDRLDAGIARRAGADAVALDGARLRTLPLARVAAGDAEAAARWRAGAAARLGDRVEAAYDAAPALEAAGTPAEAEAAWRLAASPYDVDRHPFESIAARLHLADRADAAEARALRAFVDRAWSGADPGLRDAVRR